MSMSDDYDMGDLDVDPVCRFAKHEGERWEAVVESDRRYVEWLISGEPDFDIDDDLGDYLTDLLEEAY